MNPQHRKKCRLQVEALEGRMALSSGALTSGLEGVIAIPTLVAPEAGSASTQATRPTLQLGSRGEDVKYLQSSLEQLGYSVGSAGVDGIFGPDTRGAVGAFQKDHPPLVVDGIVGPKTWSALEQAQKDASHMPPDAGHLAIAEARKFLGYREGPNNENRFSAYFHRDHEPWCADFVSYCFEKTGHPLGQKGVGFASVESMVAWFRQRGHWDSQPKVGAVVAFNWPNTGKKYDHVGIVTKVTGSQITYISGNTTAPHGGRDGVFEKTISRNSPDIIGYGHR